MPRRLLRRAKKLPMRRSDRLRLLRRSLLRATRKRPASNSPSTSTSKSSLPSTSSASAPPSKIARVVAATATTDSNVTKELHVRQQACSSSSSAATDDYFPFGLLPPHIQKHIFQFLPLRCRVRLERVCRWWRRLLGDCWEHVTTADIPATVTDCFNIRPIDDNHVCGFLRKCGRHLRKIDFFFPHFHIGEHVLFSISQRCCQLRELRLMTDVNGVSMTFLLKAYSHQLSKLESLSISYQAEDGPGIHNGLRAIARAMTSLVTFRLDCYNMPPSVGALFPNSQHMRLYSLLLRQPPAPSRIDQTRWKWVTAEYVDHFLAYLADIYPQLEELDLSLDTNYQVNETQVLKHLRRIGSERPLKRLNLRLSCLFEDYDVWFGATALQALADWPHLTDLSLWTCQLPDNFIDTLATSGLGARLTKLRLSIVRSLSHDYLTALFARCPRLEAFSLIYSVDDHFHSPRSITADTIESLWMYCPRLVEVELMDCDHVDLTLVIPSMHRYMHAKRPDTVVNRTAPSLTLELSYKTRLNIRLRSLTRLNQCCMRTTRRRDDLFFITLARQCNRA